MRDMTKLVQYEIHQEVQTAGGRDTVILMTNTAPDPTPEMLKAYEARLAPRIREYEKFGKITVMRQTREEVKL